MTTANRYYGLRSWRAWMQDRPTYLKQYKESPDDAWLDDELVHSYRRLLDIVAFLQVMNKRHHLLFRGQRSDKRFTPTLLRDSWTPPAADGRTFSLSDDRGYYWTQLPNVCSRVTSLLDGKLPRHAPFDRYEEKPHLRVAPWAVIQHYEVWPTPLLDFTTSLRVAASFALGASHRCTNGYLYVIAVDEVVNDVMDLDEGCTFAAVRLSAVCPPDTARPHLQEAYLVGNPNFDEADLVEGAGHAAVGRLVAKLRLESPGAMPPAPFFDADFPRHRHRSLFPAESLLDDLTSAIIFPDQGGRPIVRTWEAE